MTRIFIEAERKETPEYNFLQTIIDTFFPHAEVEFVPMNGIGNLYNETNLNQIKLAQALGEQVLVFADADTKAKGYGYIKRKEEIDKGMTTNNITFPYFNYPNNQDDGDVETLMESTARRDLHSTFFDCFEDYELCVLGAKDDSGQPRYNTPNLKGKLHTYMNAQKLSSKLRRRLGSGDWLFDNKEYWDLEVEALQPIKEFFAANLI